MPTSESSLEALENRVAKLEAQNRRLKKAGIASLLLAVAVITMGQAKSDRTIEADTVKAHTVTADVIQLTDAESHAVTLLVPGLVTVQTNSGKDRVIIDTSEGPSVHVTDREGFSAALGVSSLVTTKTGYKNQTSAAAVVLFGKDNKVLWSAP
jgi:hypothetical protein